jgi:hypothetical protein
MPDFGLVCAAAEKRARARDVNPAAGDAGAADTHGFPRQFQGIDRLPQAAMKSTGGGWKKLQLSGVGAS